MKELKRWWIIGNEAYTVKQEENEPLAFHAEQVEVVEASEYNKVVDDLTDAEYIVRRQDSSAASSRALQAAYVRNEKTLKKKIEQLENKIADAEEALAMYANVDGPGLIEECKKMPGFKARQYFKKYFGDSK